jgi:2-polyprenyl-3-methyl-5-hydroxy-6-metoxy-1,4-benzoquinol methylase
MRHIDAPLEYFARPRDDIFSLLPQSPNLRVLDVGCGEGALSLRLKNIGQIVYGIELSPLAASKAAQVMDNVLIGDAELLEFDFDDGFFDTIILGDILEHFYDPWGFLRKINRIVKVNGTVVASIPNIQYFPILLSLVLGRFQYKNHGILDISHIRFFTTKEVKILFREGGFVIANTPRIYPYKHAFIRNIASAFDRLTFRFFSDFLVGNIYVIAKKV